ncbi:MAG: ABC transporter permease [Paludibacteraceae bacterium]|nr:ABC transporter permease [Paludibacteraceae bacterium]
MPLRAETFIAHRLYFAHQGEKRASRPAVKVALAGIIIGVVVMLLTLCVVVGFKRTVAEQIAGFGSHIQVTNFENNNTYELSPITVTDSLLDTLRSLPYIRSAHTFLTKPGVLKTTDAVRGVVLKGTSYYDYFDAHLSAGRLPQSPQQVLLSRSLSQLMRLDVDSSFYCYFVGDNLRVRKLTVSGIYSTGLAEFDNLFIITPEATLRQLNQWPDSSASGIELMVDNLTHLDEAADAVYFATVNRLQDNGEVLYTQTIEQLNPQIFSWLDLLDMNVVVILILMLCVAGFNIISGLIILILDSIRLIGVLKALGADNRFVRRIFITQSILLVGRGMLWGNAIGLALAALQYFTHILPLDAATYYVSYVPIAFPWGGLVALNIGTIIISLLILLAPSAIVTRISPARVMHFD